MKVSNNPLIKEILFENGTKTQNFNYKMPNIKLRSLSSRNSPSVVCMNFTRRPPILKCEFNRTFKSYET
jgi:hypothetical protein